MKWGEIQIESLKKMFLNNDNLEINKLDEYKNNKKYKTYLFAMPQACNEAIDYLITNGIPFIRSYQLEKDETSNQYDLSKIDNFKCLSEIYYEGNSNISWRTIGNTNLIVDNWEDGILTIYYESYHDDIKSTTPNKYELEISKELCKLIPLYIAGSLYKDDDISLATMYMNEFESKVDRIANRYNNNYQNGNPSIQTVFSIGM